MEVKKYYISNGETKEGPYSIEDIRNIKFDENSLIWKEGFTNWKRINEINELSKLLQSFPPPLPNNKNLKSNEKSYFKFFVFIFLSLFTFGVLISSINLSNGNNISFKHFIENVFSYLWIAFIISLLVTSLYYFYNTKIK